MWWHYALPDAQGAPGPVVRLYAAREEIAVFQGSSNRSQIWVPLPQIPRPVVHAVLAAEDRRFLQHQGIDLLAVLRAARTNLRYGEVHQGGSTITQQLARTLFLTTDRTWGRKLREAVIAVLLESRYPKERILEAYLNTVYLGQDGDVAVHGVGAAARHFLHKDLGALRLDEAALLAAAISAPNRMFSGDPARAKRERDRVLQAMRQQGMVGEAATREAMARPLRWQAAGSAVRAPYFADLAREEIARRVVLPASGEVGIATTLDPILQRDAEAAIRDGIDRIERRQDGLGRGKVQGALVAIEPATGQIRALIGGRRYLDSPFNRATRAARQPGSVFKPIVYLAAFEAERTGQLSGLTPASLVPDEPIDVPAGGGRWSPHNLDRRFHGMVTVRRALEESLNVPAVRVARDVGLDKVADAARALGITSPLVSVPSLALGTSEVSLLEITAAFATLANQGIRATPTTLEPEQDQAPPPVLTPLPPPERVVSAESSFLVTNILRGVVRSGTGRASAAWGLSDLTAGKTGSTEGLRDAWFIGYTPDLVVGVWVGRDDDTPLGLTGAQAALPIWLRVMQAAVRRVAPRPFTPPSGVVFASIDRDTGQQASFWCGGGTVIEEAFRAGTEPRGGCGGAALARQADSFLDWLRGLFR
jgi:penicillin-binding protein 1B